ncbi:MAG TPA: hypothetical protein VJB99_01635 [Patescibacteria group bacterium]|nr:hypothetical protein [Patescibacteria group bacterium]
MNQTNDPRRRPRHRPRREVEGHLRRIYADADGTLPNFKTLERRRSSVAHTAMRLAFFFILAAAGAWTAFFLLWQPYVARTSKPLSLSVEGPPTAVSGAPASYRIRYANPSRISITSLEMDLLVPRGFSLSKTNPPPTDGTHWTFGPLSPGSDGFLEITGSFQSPVPSTEKIQGIFTYRQANTSSEFKEIASMTTDVNTSVLSVKMEGPPKAIPGDETVYTVSVRNAGADTLRNILLRADLPTSFHWLTAKPDPRTPSLAEWNLPTLAPGEETLISINGSFGSDASGTATAKATVGFLDEKETFLSQGEAEISTDVLGANLAVHLIVNGTDQNQTVPLGEPVALSIDFAQQGKEATEDVSIVLVFSTPDERSLPIHWEKADTAGGRREGDSLIWDASNLAKLTKLSPGDNAILDLLLPLPPSIDPMATADVFTVDLSVRLQKVGSVQTDRTLKTPTLEIKLQSDTHASSAAKYFNEEGAPLGSGPIPPTVDQTTTYRIFWNLENSLHDLERVRMTTSLPATAAWKGINAAGVGSLSYDSTTRIVTWSVDHLSKETTTLQAWFDVAVTPSTADVGSFFKLTNATALEAMDTFTKNPIHQAMDALDTELLTDAFATGKGVVVGE